MYIYLYISVYKIEPMRSFIIFCTDSVGDGVKNFKYVCPENKFTASLPKDRHKAGFQNIVLL